MTVVGRMHNSESRFLAYSNVINLPHPIKDVSLRNAGEHRKYPRRSMKAYRAELDMETLVWTRGRGFPRPGSRRACVAHCAAHGRSLSHSSCRESGRSVRSARRAYGRLHGQELDQCAIADDPVLAKTQMTAKGACVLATEVDQTTPARTK
jgi:hypothetical protein